MLKAKLTGCRHSDTTQRTITQHTQVLFNAGPPVRRWPSVKATCIATRLHVTVAYHIYTHNMLVVAQPMLTWLHAAGWCLVDYYCKPADFLGIQGIEKHGGGGGGSRLLEGCIY